jgi:hypothetical protein
MKNHLLTLGILLLVLGVGIFAAFYFKSPGASFHCDQSATTTPCSELERLSRASAIPSTTSTVSTQVTWKRYTNDTVGISFLYPDTGNLDTSGQWSIIPGDGGQTFGGNIRLPTSGALVQFVATTKDYSAPKEGMPIGTEGFVVQNGKYRMIRYGKVSETSFVPDIPDEVWTLSNGSNVPVWYGKNYDPHSDEPNIPISAMINIPNRKMFRGIGFVLWYSDNQGPHAATPEDVNTFKKVITSIEFIK